MKSKGKMIICIACVTCIAQLLCSCAKSDYNKAVNEMENGNYVSALSLLENNPDYLDASELIKECNYQIGISFLNEGYFDKAYSAFLNCSHYKNSDAAQLWSAFYAARNEVAKKLADEIHNDTASFTYSLGAVSVKKVDETSKTITINHTVNVHINGNGPSGVKLDVPLDDTMTIPYDSLNLTGDEAKAVIVMSKSELLKHLLS